MKHLVSSWTGLARAAAVAAWVATVASTAAAGTLQDNLLFKPEALQARPRLFFKLSYLNAHIKTTSKDARDVTGPVLARGDFGRYLFTDDFVSSFETRAGGTTVRSMENLYDPDSIDVAQTIEAKYDQQADESHCEAARAGIGTPCGIRVKSNTTVSTAALSLVYFLDEAYSWAIEAFVLAAPVHAGVNGDGNNHLRGQKIVDTRLLPPIVTLGHYFGNSPTGLRPYLGLGLSYAIFYNTRATQALNAYQGGSNVGDTTVHISNSWGAGPFMGLHYGSDTDGWQYSLSIGRLRYKTESTLVTRNTRFTNESVVLQDFGAYVSSGLAGADGTYKVTDPTKAITVKTTGAPVGFQAGQAVHVTTAVMCDLARAKNGSQDCNQGTFVRKAATTLDNTMYMLSLSRRF
jgi:outer membrane protein